MALDTDVAFLRQQMQQQVGAPPCAAAPRPTLTCQSSAPLAGGRIGAGLPASLAAFNPLRLPCPTMWFGGT
jgi:hypothetical protein